MLACLFAALALPPELRVLPPGQLPDDKRLATTRDLNGRHPSELRESPAEWWLFRRPQLVTQTLVSQGLWPLPPRTALRPAVHTPIDQGDYTVEHVLLATRPGHYLAGNLYRPKGAAARRAAVLFAHGHWADGRFHDAGADAAKKAVESGGERYVANARFLLQAMPAALARQGYVAFAYDMVGNADSAPLDHPKSTLGKFNGGFDDLGSVLWLHSFMGLQTWNSLRALDFVASLPDVDPRRIAVTGASGGGTQTFMLCGIDDRPAISFPAVMVSTGMQGGCVCENAALLRLGTGNVELAALHAPKPLGLIAANDWTKEIEAQGLPELQGLYARLGAHGAVAAWARVQFPHNYNHLNRASFFDFLAPRFGGPAGFAEPELKPLAAAQLSAFDARHPRPADFEGIPELKRRMVNESQAAAAVPWPAATLRPALAAAIGEQLRGPGMPNVVAHRTDLGRQRLGAATMEKWLLRRGPETLYPDEAVPVAALVPAKFARRIAVWLDPNGHAGLFDDAGKPRAAVAAALAAGLAIVAPDAFLTGEYHLPGKPSLPRKLDPRFPGYTFCYNRALLADRVHDALTAVAAARDRWPGATVDLVGVGAAGPWAILAKGLAGDDVRRLAADAAAWRFSDIRTTDDPNILPGGLKYGDVPGFAALAAPGAFRCGGFDRLPPADQARLKAAFAAAAAADLLKPSAPPSADDPGLAAWLAAD